MDMPSFQANDSLDAQPLTTLGKDSTDGRRSIISSLHKAPMVYLPMLAQTKQTTINALGPPLPLNIFTIILLVLEFEYGGIYQNWMQKIGYLLKYKYDTSIIMYTKLALFT